MTMNEIQLATILRQRGIEVQRTMPEDECEGIDAGIVLNDCVAIQVGRGYFGVTAIHGEGDDIAFEFYDYRDSVDALCADIAKALKATNTKGVAQ